MVPPFTGLAVNVTVDPRHTGFTSGLMVMLTGRFGLTDTGYWALGTGLVIVHISDDVNVQETRSPFTGI